MPRRERLPAILLIKRTVFAKKFIGICSLPEWAVQNVKMSKCQNVRSQKPEARSQKPEARSQKPEARSQKPEARSQKPEARSQNFKNLKSGKSRISRDRERRGVRSEFQPRIRRLFPLPQVRIRALRLSAPSHLYQVPGACIWCRHEESNPGPTDYKSVALPTELCRHRRTYLMDSASVVNTLVRKTCKKNVSHQRYRHPWH